MRGCICIFAALLVPPDRDEGRLQARLLSILAAVSHEHAQNPLVHHRVHIRLTHQPGSKSDDGLLERIVVVGRGFTPVPHANLTSLHHGLLELKLVLIIAAAVALMHGLINYCALNVANSLAVLAFFFVNCTCL